MSIGAIGNQMITKPIQGAQQTGAATKPAQNNNADASIFSGIQNQNNAQNVGDTLELSSQQNQDQGVQQQNDQSSLLEKLLELLSKSNKSNGNSGCQGGGCQGGGNKGGNCGGANNDQDQSDIIAQLLALLQAQNANNNGAQNNLADNQNQKDSGVNAPTGATSTPVATGSTATAQANAVKKPIEA